ncbi:voltage-dependent anion channel [Tricharina praecox]|uniref:voltage-dependent anion channel n=1 Tax=Tricharina praecox TaxID=43433 RepID=UPI00221FBE5C|nr:voltage-dependent anion channel [Tricharina praecox]KAI5854473.1 voltage-dependent anion channel [Tricharina praecox]
MSRLEPRIDANDRSDRTPLLGTTAGTRYNRERGDLPLWRHVLENKMTWAWYNVIIASGGVSLLIFNLPYRVHRLWVLGAIVYVISLILFLITLLVHAARFIVRPSLLPNSICHPVEGLHVSTLPAALGILILNGATYSEKMHGYNGHAMRSFFWIYIILSLVFGIGTPLVQFAKGAQNRPAMSLSAASIGTTLPLLLAGPTAAAVLAHLPIVGRHRTALGIMAFGVALQGMGVFVSLLYQSSVIARLHNDGFPHPRERPSLFLTSIPAALSAWASTALAQQALRHFPTPSTAPGGAPELVVGGVALYYVGVTLGLVFWGLALWWFVIAACACIGGLNEMRAGGEILEGFIVVFAHVAFFLASNELLRAFDWPRGLTIMNEVLGVATIAVWGLLMVGCLLGLVTGRFARD